MNKRAWKGIFWGLAVVLVGVLALWDIHNRPLKEEEGKVFTVLNASAMTGEGATVVSIVRSDFPDLPEPVDTTSTLTYGQVKEIVRKAVTLGELEEVLHDAEEGRSGGPLWVVIKPNIVELKERGSGVITDWRVVKAIIQFIHEITPNARITIAEGPGGWVSPSHPEVEAWSDVGDGFEVAGYRQLLSDPELSGIPLDIVDLNFDEAIETPVPGKWYARETYFIPKTVLDCDVLIDVPVLKITGSAGMTVAMKNFVGIAPGMVYGWAKMSGYPPGSGNPGIPHSNAILDETIADLTSLSGVDFSVVDAIVGMERAKTDEDGGRPVRMNTVVAGADVVAVDAVCAQLMGMNPDDFEHITLAHTKGLGVGRLSDIRIIGQRMEDVARRFEKYPADWGSGGEYGHYGQGNRIWLLKGPIPRDTVLPDPTDFYPLPGQNGWSEPVYFHDDKIDLDRYYNDPMNCVAYAYTEFDAPATGEAHLWVGSDEGMQVWINGEKIYRFEGVRRHHLPNERVPISIQKGRNTCLVEAMQTSGRYEFSLKICEPEEDPRYDGNTVFGLKYYVPKTATSRTEELAAVDERRRRGEWYEDHYVDVTQPGRVKLSAFLPGEAEGPWIGLDVPIMWGEIMEAQAQIRERRIELWTENVRRFHLKVEGPLAELGRSLNMDMDGFAVRVKKVAEGDRVELEADLGQDGEVKGWVAKKGKAAPEDQMVLGSVPSTLIREGTEPGVWDSPLGNWFTDAIRWGTGADVAFQNNGGIRKDLEEGPVTVEDIFEMNFPDELYTFRVTGKELLAILEHDVRDEKERPMQMSGLRYTFDRSRPAGSRIIESTVDPDKVYTVGAEDYLCHRGQRFFGGEVAFTETGVQIVDAQIRYVRKMGEVVAKSEGRIREIGAASRLGPSE